MSLSELCEVVITAPEPDWLQAFSRRLVDYSDARSETSEQSRNH